MNALLSIIASSRRRTVAFAVAGSSRYESTSTSTTHTITAPSGTAVGDLLVAMVTNGGAASPQTPPTGWTSLSSSGSSQAHWKIADSGDLASLVFTFAASRNCGIVIYRITGAHATTPVSGVVSTTLDPANLSPGWGTINMIGITFMGSRNSASAIGTVTPPSGTGSLVSSPPNTSSTITGQSYGATISLTSVSSWNPATWAVSGTTDTPRTYTILIQPA